MKCPDMGLENLVTLASCSFFIQYEHPGRCEQKDCPPFSALAAMELMIPEILSLSRLCGCSVTLIIYNFCGGKTFCINNNCEVYCRTLL